MKKINRIYVPDSVKGIENYAFDNFDSLVTVRLSSNITEIPPRAFSFCRCLESVICDAPHLYINSSAFDECVSLVKIPDSCFDAIGGQAFYSCKSLDIDYIYGDEIVWNWAFRHCISLKELTLDYKGQYDGYTYMSRAFADCINLEKVIIKNGYGIEDKVFSGCKSLKEVHICDSIKKIEEDAFEDCYPDLTIYCSKGSYAHKYAIDNSLKFVLV